MVSLAQLLSICFEHKASDVHFSAGSKPTLRVSRRLLVIDQLPVLSPKDTKNIALEMLNSEQRDILEMNREIDLSYDFGGRARFRVNIFYERASVSASLRRISAQIPTFEELHLISPVLRDFCRLPHGLVLVTGSAGMGKSTTIAAMVGEINRTRSERIVTIEDPIEYVFQNDLSLINQREMHVDSLSWESALRSVLREDPNVIVIGEMRDFETIASAVTIAETGHLVLSTLHTNTAAQTIDRIVDVFPEHQQSQIKVQLAASLKGVFCQKLIPSLDGGVAPAAEVLLSTPAVQTTIREGRTHQIDNIISTSLDLGMVSFERSLAELVKSGVVSSDQALKNTIRPGELERLLSSRI